MVCVAPVQCLCILWAAGNHMVLVLLRYSCQTARQRQSAVFVVSSLNLIWQVLWEAFHKVPFLGLKLEVEQVLLINEAILLNVSSSLNGVPKIESD